MTSTYIEQNVKSLVENFDKDNFIFNFLLAYGISKTSVTRLRIGDLNMSKIPGEVLYKKKVLFKEVDSDKLLVTIDSLTKDENALKHNPRFVIVTDYKTLLAKDTRTGLTLDTPVLEIPKHYDFFLPWAGQEKYQHKNENYADRKASYEMAKLYDILVHENPGIYADGGHNLNIFLSRLLFCFFAEDTEIFPEEGMFTATLAQHTKEDGSDVHEFLNKLFTVLNTEDNSKEADYLQKFPYVNGGLFRDTIHSPKFSRKARKIILECGTLNWSEINPDIFGSMIQAVVNPEYRSGLGMHYTSVPNIMKVIEPLFLNELYDEFEKAKENDKALRRLIFRISKLKIFDPACGSGNFLIIAYKELRKLEIEIWKQIDLLKQQTRKSYQTETVYTEVKLSQFYGIELDDFAHEMALLSLWLAEHQMNKMFIDELFDFGRAKPILPLKEAGHIARGNAVRVDWEEICPRTTDDEIYILGNPPYLGSSVQDKAQKADMEYVFSSFKNYKNLDYIACWFKLGADYVKKSNARFCFVSTNSVCQGEQVALLWPYIFNNNLEISFAHTSFKWTNNAKGNAGVTVIIVGVQNKSNRGKFLFHQDIKQKVENINAYLIDGPNIIFNRSGTSISGLPELVRGSMPTDGGHFTLTDDERNKLIEDYPESEKLIKRYVSGGDFLNGKSRWCLWIPDKFLDIATSIPFIADRLNKVKEFRLKSDAPSTIEYAAYPNRFRQVSFTDTDSIIIPLTSSIRRKYIPFDFLQKGTVVTNSAGVIYNAEFWHFGIISSYMHMVWVSVVAGRLKTDYRYSSVLCYNNFPFPSVSQKQKEILNLHVLNILEEREKFSERTLSQLYDPNKMPRSLKDAHYELDMAVDRCYTHKAFSNDNERLEILFKLYEQMTKKSSLFMKQKKIK